MKNYFLALPIFALLFLSSCQEKKTETTTETSTESVIDTAQGTLPKETISDEFRIIENSVINKLNNTITQKKIVSEEEMMQVYSPKDKGAEGNYKYIITKISSGNGKTIVQLIEENLTDDSVKDKKVIMRIIKNKEGKSVVDEIKESYICRLDRGQQDWSATLCQ